jgi:hypothetical protein
MLGTGYVQTTALRGRSGGKNKEPYSARELAMDYFVTVAYQVSVYWAATPSGGSGAGRLGGGGYNGISLLG